MWQDMTKNNERSELKSLIDDNLKRVYQEALDEEVPDRLKDLLEELRKKMAKK